MAGLHTDDDAPALAAQLDLNGDEYALPGNGIPSAVRGFRTREMTGTTAPAAPALGDSMGARAAEHATRGQADDRRDDGFTPGDASRSPQRFTNERTAVVVEHPSAPPARPRQGFTGDDPTRPSLHTRPTMLRPFDKNMADHPGPVVKVAMDSPLAARPATYNDLTGGLPGAMGSTGTAREGVGPTRNSFRIVPKAWDSLIVTPAPAVSAADPARSRSFRR